MNKITKILLATLFACSPFSSRATEEVTPAALEPVSYPIFFVTEYLNALWPISAEDVQFVRDHAENIGQELYYALDHSAALQEASKQEFIKLINRLEKFHAQDSLVVFADALLAAPQKTTVGDFLKHPETKAVLKDLKAHALKLQKLLLQRYPAANCPILNSFLSNTTDLASQVVQESYALFSKEAAAIVLQMPSNMDKLHTQRVEAIKKAKTAIIGIMNASIAFEKKHKNLYKQLISAWVKVMKDDLLFNELQHYFNLSDAPNPILQAVEAALMFQQDILENNQKMPDSLQQFFDIAQRFSTTQQEFMGKELEQLANTLQSIVLRY
jgi:hypothetical protein